MGWLFALVFGAVPRVGTLLLWRARPDRVAAAFGGRRVWPALGLVFLPLTTLLYVLRRLCGLAGRDWLWLLLALALDVGQAGRPAGANRNRRPDATGSTAAPQLCRPSRKRARVPRSACTGWRRGCSCRHIQHRPPIGSSAVPRLAVEGP